MGVLQVWGKTTEDACVLQMYPICIKCSPWVCIIAFVLTMRHLNVYICNIIYILM